MAPSLKIQYQEDEQGPNTTYSITKTETYHDKGDMKINSRSINSNNKIWKSSYIINHTIPRKAKQAKVLEKKSDLVASIEIVVEKHIEPSVKKNQKERVDLKLEVLKLLNIWKY